MRIATGGGSGGAQAELSQNNRLLLALCAGCVHIKGVIAVHKSKKAERLVARVSEADKELFQRAALLEGRSMATFVVAHARDAAQRIVNENATIRLNAEQSRRFVEALLAPPRPIPKALRRATRDYKERVITAL